jgi:hypothetical protein
MVTGPVEYLVLAFADGAVSADIVPELADLVDKKVIRILDAVVVTKHVSGEVFSAELDDIDGLAAFLDIDGESGGLIGPDDVSFVGEDLDPGSWAVVLLLEDLCAAPLASARPLRTVMYRVCSGVHTPVTQVAERSRNRGRTALPARCRLGGVLGVAAWHVRVAIHGGGHSRLSQRQLPADRSNGSGAAWAVGCATAHAA